MFYDLVPLDFISDEVLLVVRLIMGITMVYYGWPKMRDLSSNAKDFVRMGFKPGWFWGTIVAFLEFFGGVMIMLGVAVWLPSFLMVVHMATGTIWKVSKVKKPFTDYSYDLLILALALLLLVTGSGAYSLLG